MSILIFEKKNMLHIFEKKNWPCHISLNRKMSCIIEILEKNRYSIIL